MTQCTMPWILAFWRGVGCGAGCSDEPAREPSDAQENGNNPQNPEETTLDLDTCSSRGGGRLNETQCNRAWDCSDRGIFEILCNGDGAPEVCRCLQNDEEITTFTADQPGGFCDAFSTGEFATNVTKACGFSQDKTSEESND